MGDDSGRWAFDGECDDPRFVDQRTEASDDEQLRDATDCGQGLRQESAEIRPLLWKADFFGEDDSESGVAGDGVCNDPRFAADPRHPKVVNGTGLVKRDATDCRRAFLMRQAWVLESVNLRDGRSSKLAFGDDSGRWALDDECDDPRFVDLRTEVSGGEPMRDATDCRDAYVTGNATLLEDFLNAKELLPQGFNLGDDSGRWAFDGECDDPRFVDQRTEASDDEQLRDATDCGQGLAQGKVKLQ